MPTRAWCMDCGGYTVLSPQGECPAGHARSALRGLEEVPDGYVAPAPRPVSVAQTASFADAGLGMQPQYAGVPTPSIPTSPAPVGGTADIDPMLKLELERNARRVYHDVPWYETWPGMAVVFVLIWPLGVFLLWRSPVPTRNQKWAVTAGVAALVIFNLARFVIGMSVAMSSTPTPPLQ